MLGKNVTPPPEISFPSPPGGAITVSAMNSPAAPPNEPLARLLTTSEQWSRLNISLLWVYRGKMPGGASGFIAVPTAAPAWLILKGSASVTAHGHTHSARAGEWFFPRPVPWVQQFSKDAEIFSIRYRMGWPDGTPLFDTGPGLTLRAAEYPELLACARHLERVVRKLTSTRFHDASFGTRPLDFLQYLQIEKAAHRWGETVYRAFLQAGLKPTIPQTGDPRIHPILHCLDTWPLAIPYAAADIARRTGMSRSTLERILEKALGITGKAYVERRRLNLALERLLNPSIPVKQIASETGFSHTSSFSAWFKSKTGCAPGQMPRGTP